MSKTNTQLQPIRLSTIKHQLKSLSNQARAIQTLDSEHRHGYDFGADPTVTVVVNHAKRLVTWSEEIIKKSNNADVAAVCALLEKIRGDLPYVLDRACAFKHFGEASASSHLEEMVHAKPSDLNLEGEPGDSSFKLAGISCFNAEVNQCRTFELQAQALGYLALEIAYFAADEVDLKLNS